MLKNFAKKALRKKKEPLADYSYSIDVVSAERVSGWAKNIKLPNHSPVIDVYINGLLTWQAKCNQFRQDLKDHEIGNYAFELTPDTSVMQSDCDEVEIRIDGHLLPSKYPLTLSKNADDKTSPAQPTIQKEDITCYLDEVTSTHVRGWAKLNTDDTSRLIISIKNGTQLFASGEASLYRDDLAANSIGDGRYAFELALDLAEFDAETVEADLYVNGIKFSEKKIQLTASASEIEHAKYTKEFAPEIDRVQQQLTEQLATIKQEISNQYGNEPALKDLVQYTLQSISELNVRIAIMEKAMLKHISSKD